MRIIFAILLVLCAACQPSHTNAVAQAEREQAEIILQARTKQSPKAFGGTVIGKDKGEWGGEVAFVESNGNTYRLVADNSHGIFDTANGVVALTGLAHRGINRGTVYRISRRAGERVEATATLRLPGSPCDVIRTDRGIKMRIFMGVNSTPNGRGESVFGCYSLRSPEQLVKIECPTSQSPVCFG